MKNILRLAIGLLIPIAVYSCSSDDEDDTSDGTGGEQSKGGSSSTGIKPTGGRTNTGTTVVKPSTGGTTNSTSSVISKGGATQTGGGAAGQPFAGAAGSSITTTVGGAGGATGTGANAGVAGINGLAGASSTVLQSCNALCGSAASCKTACMDESFGYESDAEIPFCLPQTTILNGLATLCANSQCSANQPGCPLTLVLGTSEWKYTPEANRTTKVRLDTTLKNIRGTIDMSAPTLAVSCTLTPVLPSAGLALTANGTVAPKSGNPSLLGVTVNGTAVDLSSLRFSSANATCETAANGFASNTDALTQELLAALQARAAELTCLECDSRCSQNIACTAPAL